MKVVLQKAIRSILTNFWKRLLCLCTKKLKDQIVNKFRKIFYVL